MKLINKKNSFLFSLIVLLIACGNRHPEENFTDWKITGGGKRAIHYSSLNQVDTSNVAQLKVAWVYRTGDADTITNSQIQCNPIIVDGVMFATSPQLKLVAIDAATGKEKWVFDPRDSLQNKRWFSPTVNNNRGVTYWEDVGEKRVLYTVGSIVYALNAATGQLIPTFGAEGGFDLHDALDRDDVSDLYIAPTSPGIIYRDLYIIGGRVNETQQAAPGHIRAFDVRTGQRKWIFHTIPHPGQRGYETWEDSLAYKNIGGANNWAGFSLDEERGILFVPTGSASFDFYGGMRKGDNLYANSLIALDAATGKYIWHFQFVHHDVWDRDLPAAPALVRINRDGKRIDAVAQTTKQGFVFVFDRETGTPLFPVEEKPVPHASPLSGEQLSPTQPVPMLPKPFVRQSMTEAEINNIVPDSSYDDIKTRLSKYNSGHLYTPPSKEGTIIFPGFDGGAEWGGPAYDPELGWLYVNANEMPWVLTMVDAKDKVAEKENYGQAGKRIYRSICMSCHGPDRKGAGNFPTLINIKRRYSLSQLDTLLVTGRRMMPGFSQLSAEERKAVASYILEAGDLQHKEFISPPAQNNKYLDLPYSSTGYHKFETKDGYPAVKPPWGSLSAINLNTGEYEWKIPLGEFEELKNKAIPITGTENYGGPVVTKGGLLFIAATRDAKIRAFNKRTGSLLWEYKLPFAGYATPAVYMVNGRQYLVIACGGGKMKTRSGDAYVAFALPG